jgi:hypothetical protein
MDLSCLPRTSSSSPFKWDLLSFLKIWMIRTTWDTFTTQINNQLIMRIMLKDSL